MFLPVLIVGLNVKSEPDFVDSESEDSPIKGKFQSASQGRYEKSKLTPNPSVTLNINNRILLAIANH